MKKNQTKQAVQKAIENHASLLNQAAADRLHTCYTTDAVFMPEGHKNLSYQDLANLKSEGFLKNSGFEISYDFTDISVDEKYAFVTASAITKTKEGKKKSFKKSNDFFVLKFIGTEWKIYRHTFNNITEL